ncbi:MAG: hydrogenase maturation protease [Actinomycetes bacterium]
MTQSAAPAAPADPADVGSSCDLLVVGCGNLLRADDGVGPILVRHLWETGVPDGVRLVDGGTAGMDVSFQMRGARRVILVDACTTGEPPGTVYQVPGPAVEDLPPLSGLHTHLFRWDHALAFGRWLLGEEYPADITVYLIEAQDFDPGEPLSAPVRRAMGRVLELIRGEPAFRDAPPLVVEFTPSGYLRLDAATSRRLFPADAATLLRHGAELWMVPLHSTGNGGVLLKQRNRVGDRCVLVREVLADDLPMGAREARWDPVEGALRVRLDRHRRG